MSTTSPAPSQVRTMTMPGPKERKYSAKVRGMGAAGGAVVVISRLEGKLLAPPQAQRDVHGVAGWRQRPHATAGDVGRAGNGAGHRVDPFGAPLALGEIDTQRSWRSRVRRRRRLFRRSGRAFLPQVDG